MSSRRLLLLPTTEHALESLKLIYATSSWAILYCNLSKNVLHAECDFKKRTMLWRLYYSKNKIIRVSAYLMVGRVFTASIRKFLIQNNIQCLVMSNDCGFPQVYFVVAARSLGIKIVCHQVASGSISNAFIRSGFFSVIRGFFNRYINGLPSYQRFGDLSDTLVLLGPKWAVDLGITKKFSVVSNPKYSHGKKIANPNAMDKVIIFGVPLSEVPLVPLDIAKEIYSNLNDIAHKLESIGIEVKYKPHPQERLCNNFIDFSFFQGSIDSAFSEYSICMSVSSTMSLEFVLSGRYSYCLDFDCVPELLLQQTRGLFSGSFRDLLTSVEGCEFKIDALERGHAPNEYYSASTVTVDQILNDG